MPLVMEMKALSEQSLNAEEAFDAADEIAVGAN